MGDVADHDGSILQKALHSVFSRPVSPSNERVTQWHNRSSICLNNIRLKHTCIFLAPKKQQYSQMLGLIPLGYTDSNKEKPILQSSSHGKRTNPKLSEKKKKKVKRHGCETELMLYKTNVFPNVAMIDKAKL